MMHGILIAHTFIALIAHALIASLNVHQTLDGIFEAVPLSCLYV